MKKAKRSLALLCAALLLVALAACGSASESTGIGSAKSSVYAESGGAAGGQAADSAQDAAGGVSESKNAASGTDLSVSQGQTALPSADKIVYSGSVTIETRKFDDALAGLTKLVSDSGGFVENSSVSGASYDETGAQRGYRSADYTVRIPVDKLSAVSESLKSLGNVTSTQTQADNITMQYTDTQSHLDALKTQESRLLELLAKAQSMDDIIKIEDQLTQVRYQIESLTSQLKNWDNAVSYSTLEVTIDEVAYYSKDGSNGTSYGKQLSEAFVHSLYGVGRFFKGFLKVLVAALPILVVAGGVLFLVLWIRRKVKAGKAAQPPKSEEKEAEDETK